MEDKRKAVFEVLEEMGIDCVPEKTEDINLQQYIEDSFSFINFIVGIEERFNVELPDELLSYETIQSLNGFLQLIEAA